MSERIIDDVDQLLKLSSDELTEVLLENKYNKQNLRVLVKRSLQSVKTYKDAFEYQLLEKEKAEEKIERAKQQISAIL